MRLVTKLGRGNSRGVTLIELIVVLTVLSIVGTILTFILVENNELYTRQTNQVSSGLSLNQVIDIISQDMKNAAYVRDTPFTVGGETYISSLTTLVLALPSIDTNNNTIPGYDHVVIFPDRSVFNILRRTVVPGNGSARRGEQKSVLINNLKQILFEYSNDTGLLTPGSSQTTKVKTTLTVAGRLGQSPTSYSSSFEVKLRNKQ